MNTCQEDKVKRIRILMFILAIMVIAAAACTPDSSAEPTSTPEQPESPVQSGRERGQTAIVDDLEIMLLESFPVQVNAVVSGNLPDGCTNLDEFEVEQEGNTFNIIIWTVREPEAVCTLALVPFEESVPLEVEGLEAGEYTVIAQSQSATFTLDVDNTLQE
jgi:inhibitor of cysteine peptidase